MANAKAKTPIKKSADKGKPVPSMRPLSELQYEMDRVFDKYYFGTFHMPRLPRSLFEYEPFAGLERRFTTMAPKVDVSESDKVFEITGDLPGLDEEHIELELSDGMLTIKGENKEEREEEEKDYHLIERRSGSFSRSFRIPDTVDQDQISADFSKGVLKIKMPKTKAARKAAKKIAITAG